MDDNNTNDKIESLNKDWNKKVFTAILIAFISVSMVGICVIVYMAMDTYSNLYDEAEAIHNIDGSMQKLSDLKSLINNMYLEDVDDEALIDGIYKGLLESLNDPYSVYYTAEEYTKYTESMSGEYCGIGASVGQEEETGSLYIITPFIDGPAYKAGILPGDVIMKVNGEDVIGQDLSEVVSKIKGKEGTEVVISIIREGVYEPLDITIVRRRIEAPTIDHEMLDNGIGYIKIIEFNEITANQYKNALADLGTQGMEALIVDLRNNPGGRLDVVVDILDNILPEGLIVYTKNRHGEKVEYTSDAKEEFNEPLAVIINSNSASASEVFAGAIQDYKKGAIIGTTSFGKGIVQSTLPLSDGTAIKLTVAKYYTPNGRDIHNIGIEPDIYIELNENLKQKVIFDKSEDNQLQKAIEEVTLYLNK